jgi:hypothetical protein
MTIGPIWSPHEMTAQPHCVLTNSRTKQGVVLHAITTLVDKHEDLLVMYGHTNDLPIDNPNSL